MVGCALDWAAAEVAAVDEAVDEMEVEAAVTTLDSPTIEVTAIVGSVASDTEATVAVMGISVRPGAELGAVGVGGCEGMELHAANASNPLSPAIVKHLNLPIAASIQTYVIMIAITTNTSTDE